MKRACTLIAVLFCLASPSRADFGIHSFASSDAAYNSGASASYSGGTFNLVGPYYNIQQNPPYTFASGTMDNTGLATTTQEHALSNSGPYPSAPGIVSTASSTTSLNTGTFSASASDNTDGTAPPGLYGNAEDRGFSQFADTLHFTVTGVGPTDVTYIQVRYQLSGQIGTNSTTLGSASEISQFSMSGGYYVNGSVTANPGTAPTVGYAFGAFGPGSGFTSNTANQITFVGTYAITGSSEDVVIQQLLDDEVTDGFSNYSGSISIGLPSNVSFTSDSGVFLSSNSSTVPEPASIVMLGLGLAGFAGVAHRKSRAFPRA